MDLYGSLYDCIVYVALICYLARLCVSLPTSSADVLDQNKRGYLGGAVKVLLACLKHCITEPAAK